MKTVLFACVHNAARSQMAAAFFRELADPAEAEAISAGSEPGARVDRQVVEVMREVGIDLSGAKPQPFGVKLLGEVSFLVTLGCGEACPTIPAFRREDWQVADPEGQSIERVRQIRDEIRNKVAELVEARGWGR